MNYYEGKKCSTKIWLQFSKIFLSHTYYIDWEPAKFKRGYYKINENFMLNQLALHTYNSIHSKIRVWLEIKSRFNYIHQTQFNISKFLLSFLNSSVELSRAELRWVAQSHAELC